MFSTATRVQNRRLSSVTGDAMRKTLMFAQGGKAPADTAICVIPRSQSWLTARIAALALFGRPRFRVSASQKERRRQNRNEHDTSHQPLLGTMHRGIRSRIDRCFTTSL